MRLSVVEVVQDKVSMAQPLNVIWQIPELQMWNILKDITLLFYSNLRKDKTQEVEENTEEVMALSEK